MKPFVCGSIVAVLLLSLAVASPVRADRSGVDTLKGLHGVQVVVEDVDPNLEAAGVTKDEIQTKVEDELKEAGIKVFDEDDWKADDAHPYLYLRVNSMQSDDGKFFAFSLDVELHQDVNIPRDNSIESLASTWETGSFGLLETENAKHLYGNIKKQVGEFIDDFNAQNGSSSSKLPVIKQPKVGQVTTSIRRVASAR